MEASQALKHEWEPQEQQRRLNLVIPKNYAAQREKRMAAKAAMANLKEVPEALQLLLHRAGEFSLLEPEEEISLAKRIEQGDLKAKEKLFNSNLRLVVHNARKYQNLGLDLDDVIEEGMLGLTRATEKFDWRKGFRFSTYATLWIRQAIQRGLENTSRTIRLPVHVAQKAHRLDKIIRQFATKFSHEPSIEELAEAASMSVEEVQEVLDAKKIVASLDKPIGDEEDSVLGEFISTGEDVVYEEVEGDLLERRVEQALLELPERERTIIEARFGLSAEGNPEEPQTLRGAGRMVNVTPERARQIENHALIRLGGILIDMKSPDSSGPQEAPKRAARSVHPDIQEIYNS